MIIPSEVLAELIQSKEVDYSIEGSLIIIRYQDEIDDCLIRQINIHELAHECKELAIKKFFASIESSVEFHVTMDDEPKTYFYTAKVHYGCLREEYEVEGDTEAQAIFEALKWIIENKKHRSVLI